MLRIVRQIVKKVSEDLAEFFKKVSSTFKRLFQKSTNFLKKVEQEHSSAFSILLNLINKVAVTFLYMASARITVNRLLAVTDDLDEHLPIRLVKCFPVPKGLHLEGSAGVFIDFLILRVVSRHGRASYSSRFVNTLPISVYFKFNLILLVLLDAVQTTAFDIVDFSLFTYLNVNFFQDPPEYLFEFIYSLTCYTFLFLELYAYIHVMVGGISLQLLPKLLRPIVQSAGYFSNIRLIDRQKIKKSKK